MSQLCRFWVVCVARFRLLAFAARLIGSLVVKADRSMAGYRPRLWLKVRKSRGTGTVCVTLLLVCETEMGRPRLQIHREETS